MISQEEEEALSYSTSSPEVLQVSTSTSSDAGVLFCVVSLNWNKENQGSAIKTMVKVGETVRKTKATPFRKNVHIM